MVLDVFIVTYNRSRYLKDAIESILNQTYSDFQLTILDNCSTDNTEEVVRSFNDNRIRYIKNEENLGAWGNVNKAFSLADKKYYIVNHDDDIMMPDYLEKAVGFMEENDDVSVLSLGIDNIDAEADYSQCVFKKDYRKCENIQLYSGESFFCKYIRKRQSIAFPTLIYRNFFMKENNITINPDAGPSADVLLMFEVERYGGTIAEINGKYLLFRLHTEQWSQVARVEMIVKLFSFLNKDPYYAQKLETCYSQRGSLLFRILFSEVCVFSKNEISAEELSSNITTYIKILQPSKLIVCLARIVVKICKLFPKTIKSIYRVGKALKC